MGNTTLKVPTTNRPIITSNVSLHSKSGTAHSATSGVESNDSKKNETLSNIKESNGIAGEYISHQIASIVANFWRLHVDTMTNSDQLELACAIGCTVFAQDKEIKSIYFNHFRDTKVPDLSKKLFSLFGNLMIDMDKQRQNLYRTLLTYRNWNREQKIGINYKHIKVFLAALNESFSYYFKDSYNETVRHCMSQTFILFGNLIANPQETDSKDIETNDIKLGDANINSSVDLTSLDTCLRAEEGQVLIYEYLNNIFCRTEALFLKLYSEFKKQIDNEHRVKLSKTIIAKCIDGRDNTLIMIDISDKCKDDILNGMSDAESLVIADTFYDHCYQEIYQLIQKRHWNNFKQQLPELLKEIKLE